MDQNDRLNSPNPDGSEPTEPLIVPSDPTIVDPVIVEATAVPDYVADEPYRSAPTESIPVVPPLDPTPPPAVAYAPVRTVQPRQEPFPGDRNPGWPYVIAAVALLAGGLVGFLIANAVEDDEEVATAPIATVEPAADVSETLDLLLVRTQQDGEYVSPSEYSQLDEITAIDNAAATRELQEQIDLLNSGQTEATQQVTDLETALEEVTAERDALAAQLGETDGAAGETQSDLDAANEQIATLENELETARAELETANEQVAQAEAALQTATSELETANATIDALEIKPNPNYVNGPSSKARSDAAANGWTLFEVPTDSATAAPGTVLDQAPPAESNMIKGSVLYVTVAERP